VGSVCFQRHFFDFRFRRIQEVEKQTLAANQEGARLMFILINRHTKVICRGLTGSQVDSGQGAISADNLDEAAHDVAKAARTHQPLLKCELVKALACLLAFSFSFPQDSSAAAQAKELGLSDSYAVFARGCFPNVDSRSKFESSMQAADLIKTSTFEVLPKNGVLQEKLRIDASTASAWAGNELFLEDGDTKRNSFVSVWAKAEAYDGSKWVQATVCFVHTEGSRLGGMKEWSWLFRPMSLSGQREEICCYGVPDYCPHLTVFSDKKIAEKQGKLLRTYDWSRYTVIYSKSFNKQFQRVH
jgi:hypothetical protein